MSAVPPASGPHPRRVPAAALGVACAMTFVAAQVLSPEVTRAFVYFQF